MAKKIKVVAKFTNTILGTASANPEIHSEFIASKAPDAQSREEEIEAIGAEAYEEKSMTVFPKDENGHPFIFDYQIKGFFKDACGMLKACKGEKYSKHSCGIKAYKKHIDGNIFVTPRKIMFDFEGEIGSLQRPLRGQTAKGERITLANSEEIKEGAQIKFTVMCMNEEDVPAVIEWLNYGQFRGIGQWRNAGHGSFTYEYEIESAADMLPEVVL